MPQLQHFLYLWDLFGSRLANDRTAQKPQNANRKSQIANRNSMTPPAREDNAVTLTNKLAVRKPTLRGRRDAALRPSAG